MENTENVAVSLVLDGSDNPHIANGKAYSTYDGVDWHEEPVTGLIGTYYESIALDNAGRPIISALNYGGPLQCAHYDGDQWIVDELAYGLFTGSGNALAMSKGGQLSATYYDDPTDQLLYAVRQTDGWVTNVITTAFAEFPRQNTSLALDGDDRPHVAFGHYNKLNYAHWDGADWLIEQIDDLDSSPTIVVDSQNRPHTTYLGHEQARYAVRTGSGWQVEEVSQFDATISLALDSADRPNVVYFESVGDPDPEYLLRHAVLTDGGWITDTVDSGAWVNAAAIAVDDDDGLHVAYFYKEDDCELRYARRSGTEWNIEAVAPNMCHAETVDIGLDAAGRPHITFWGEARLGHAVKTEDGWQIGPVAPGRVYDNAMIVHRNVIYVSFVYDSNRGLLLATFLPLGLDESSYLPLVVRP